MIGLRRDLQQAVRALVRHPGFAAITILTLALGFGATTAIFSVVNAIVLRPLPYERSDRLMLVFEQNRSQGWTRFSVAPGNFVDWSRQTRSFEALTAIAQGRSTLTGNGSAEQVSSTRATAEYFGVLRARPLLGRTFAGDDDRPNAEAVAVMSHGLWQRRFGGAQEVVGRVVTIDGVATRVVGVMPPGFGAPNMDLWMPLTIDRQSGERGGRGLRVLGRLADGVTIEAASEELNAIAGRLALENPAFNGGWGVTLVSLDEATVGPGVRRALYILLGAVGVLLLIACVNVASLQSVRAIGRVRELAIRTALGASRWRLIRQLLVESLVLSGIGGVAGLFMAVWGRDLILALSPALPRLHEVNVDWRVLGFGGVIVLSAAVIFGLLPALGASSPNLDRTLKGGARLGTATPSRRRAGSALIVLEIGLAVVLLVGAGLLMRSFIRLSSQDPGFTPDGAVTFQVTVPEARYPGRDGVTRYLDALRARVGALPGVVAVGATHALPFTPMNSVRPFLREDRAGADASAPPVSDYRMVTPGYFAAMGIALKRGRAFTDADAAGQPAAVVVNEAFAARFLADRDPLSLRLRQAGGNKEIPWMTLVGVVADVRHGGLAATPQPEMYWVHAQATWGETLNRLRRNVMVVVRTSGDETALIPAIRAQLAALDPEVAISTPQPVRDLVSDSAASPRFNLTLMAIFAAVGLMLAVAGVYGVVSYTVTSRTRELGIRLALGAEPSALLRRVLWGAFTLAVLGLILGTVAAGSLAGLLRAQLFEVPPRDVATFAWVACILLVSTLAASLIPARRAARVPPSTALRDE
jgi:putative ABC transport system permease protein